MRARKMMQRGWQLVDCVERPRRGNRRGQARFIRGVAKMWREDGYRVKTRIDRELVSGSTTYCVLVKKR